MLHTTTAIPNAGLCGFRKVVLATNLVSSDTVAASKTRTGHSRKRYVQFRHITDYSL